MAASVRIEDEAFADERYADLAELAELADADHARGKMARLWRQCTLEQSHILGNQMVIRVLGDRGVEALIGARLGEQITDTTVRIRGTKGRIEWLAKLRENGKKGGRPRGLQTKPKGTPSGSPELNPPAPAPAPAPAPSENNPPTPRKRGARLGLSGEDRKAAEDWIAHLRGKTGIRYQATDSVAVALRARLAEGHSLDDAKLVTAGRWHRWKDDEKMRQHVNPTTLLRATHFARYLAEAQADWEADQRRRAQPESDDSRPDLVAARKRAEGTVLLGVRGE